MANLKFVVFVGFLLAFSLVISAAASEDHEAQVQEVKPTGHVDQSNCGCGRGRRCCGSCGFPGCTACCPRKMVEPEEAAETAASNCGCGRGRRCCGACAFGRCSACC